MRAKAQHPPQRSDLPCDVILRIAEKLSWLMGRIEALLLLRQVSKSWHAAVTEYSDYLTIYDQKFDRVCSILPNISQLQTDLINLDELSLRSLQTCSRLTYIDLSSCMINTAPLDLSVLPANLIRLSFDGFPVDSKGLEEMSCHSSITRFDIAHESSPADFSKLLAKFPRLTDLSVGAMDNGHRDCHWVEKDLKGNLGRAKLTWLELEDAKCMHPAEDLDCPKTLKELSLNNTGYTSTWLNTFLAQLPKLTLLRLDFPQLLDNAGNQFPLRDMIREHIPFSRLPDPSLQLSATLQVLYWLNSDPDAKLQACEIHFIASLQSLTDLTLVRFNDWADLGAMRKLPLQSLMLYECNNMELHLLVPKALSTLTELCLYSEVIEDELLQKAKPRFEQAADFLRQLPKLSCLKGECTLFEVLMEHGLQGCNFTYEQCLL